LEKELNENGTNMAGGQLSVVKEPLQRGRCQHRPACLQQNARGMTGQMTALMEAAHKQGRATPSACMQKLLASGGRQQKNTTA